MFTSPDVQYKCVLCEGKTFRSSEELDKHNREGHPTSTKLTSIPGAETSQIWFVHRYQE